MIEQDVDVFYRSTCSHGSGGVLGDREFIRHRNLRFGVGIEVGTLDNQQGTVSLYTRIDVYRTCTHTGIGVLQQGVVHLRICTRRACSLRIGKQGGIGVGFVHP